MLRDWTAELKKKLAEAKEELQQSLVKAGMAKGATFRYDERGLVVTIATDDVLFDSGSANGTFVNGERIKGACRLFHGDEVAFRNIRIRPVR